MRRNLIFLLEQVPLFMTVNISCYSKSKNYHSRQIRTNVTIARIEVTKKLRKMFSLNLTFHPNTNTNNGLGSKKKSKWKTSHFNGNNFTNE